MEYKNNKSQNKLIGSEKSIVYNNQLDQLVMDQDWRQDHRDLEQHSKYTIDPRHPHHGNLHFIRYNNNRCGIHMQRKNDTNYYPQSMLKY